MIPAEIIAVLSAIADDALLFIVVAVCVLAIFRVLAGLIVAVFEIGD